VTNLMLWGHILSVAPETSSIKRGDRFHLDTSHDRPDPFVGPAGAFKQKGTVSLWKKVYPLHQSIF
jgi:hypothetical protein